MTNLNYDPNARFDVTATDLVYLDGPTGTRWATIYQPQGPGPFPGLLDIHGGAWSRGERSNDDPMNRAFAASGIVVAAIDYRLAPEHPYPAQVEDANFATRWFKAHAAGFNVDPAAIGGMGCSSGGHTLMLSAMRPSDPRYASLPLDGGDDFDASLRFVLSCWGVLDPFARYNYARNAGEDRLVVSTEVYFLNQDALHEGNPQEILERGEPVQLPPTLIIQGTNDSNVPLSIPQRFEETFRAAGGNIEVEMFPGMPHVFGNQPFPESQKAIDLMKSFIARQLSPAPTPV